MGIIEMRAEDDHTNIHEWQDTATTIPKGRVDFAGRFITGVNSPPTSASAVLLNECAIWYVPDGATIDQIAGPTLVLVSKDTQGNAVKAKITLG